jgi:hypothetical protein
MARYGWKCRCAFSSSCFVCCRNWDASPVTSQLFGHKIEIKPIAPDNEEALFIDGEQVLKNQIISLDETGQIGSTPFAIGNSSNGGNACDGSPFVIRFAANEPVHVDGPAR